MRVHQLALRPVLSLFSIVAISVTVVAEAPSSPSAVMCVPGELLFSEDFAPATVSDRWFFKADFALRDGALVRTTVNPDESKRVFLKDPAFHNTIVEFDFKLSGNTTDLRLVTGSGGHYNSITQIRQKHFQVNTPSDREAGMVPAHLGECIRKSQIGQSQSDQWQTMTVEYWNDEVIAHLNDDEFVVGRHPIIDRTRRYFAFQFDLPGASIDNVRVWKAVGQRDDWAKVRKGLVELQDARGRVERDPVDRYKYESTNLKSRLTLGDPSYRELVATREKLQSALHADYPEAFATHKQLSKQLAARKKKIRANDATFKVMEIAVNKARRAEDDYVLSTQPELARLKQDGIAKQRYSSELGQVRAQLEANADKQLAALVAETARLQAVLENRFPEAFETVDAAVAARQENRKLLNRDPEFQLRNKAVVEAGKAVTAYLEQADPSVVQLAAEAKNYTASLDQTGQE
ncbi:MAG: hypothetical protein P1U77_10360 [Rubripirellula sp.]|nr:hypothetical protein [Rubripirellula sp.]